MKTFLVSAGHAEYDIPDAPGTIAGLTTEYVWPPSSIPEDAWWDLLENLGYETEWLDVWEQHYPGTLPPDADLSWEHIVRWTGDTDAISRGLDALMTMVSQTPGGDDDMFDYWPSGCRYALDVAAQCGRYSEVRQAILRVIALHIPADLRDELLDKTRVNVAV